jgi:hypothetical protein
MGKPTHGGRRGYLERIAEYFVHGEEAPRGQVRPEHGGMPNRRTMTSGEVLNKIAKGRGQDFTEEERDLARDLLNRF